MTKTSEFTTFYRLDREDIAAIERKAEADQDEMADELEKRIAHCEKEIGHFRELHLQLHSQICLLEDELNQLKRLAMGINRKEPEPSPKKAEESGSDLSVPYIGQKIRIDEADMASLLEQNADQRHERVWTVLDISADQKSCLVMCNESVHSMPYQRERSEIGWKSCDLRKWLNRAYCNVLSKSVASYVKVFPINNRVQDRNTPTNPFYFTTYDKIFVLSKKEYERYKRLILPTNEACWLRTPGEGNGMALAMKGNAIIEQSAMQDGGIRPAMWIGTDCEVLKKNKIASTQAPEKPFGNEEADDTGSLAGINTFSFVHGIKTDVAETDDFTKYVYRSAYKNEKAENYESAIKTYEMLGKSGFAPACIRLGHIYESQNQGKSAWEWYLKAAEEGDGEAAYFVAKYYWCGEYVHQSPKDAVKFFKIAAEKGVCEAQLALYYIYGDEAQVSNQYLRAARKSVTDEDVLNEIQQQILMMLNKNSRALPKHRMESQNR